MVLVDSSVWIAHLRIANHHRHAFLTEMDRMPTTPMATQAEMRTLVERERLMGRGLGWVDVGLLASARLGGVRLWTKDRSLRAAARALRIEHKG